MRRLALVLVMLLLATPAWAMKLNILKGTSCSNGTPRTCLVDVFMQDSSSTTGAGLTGLTNASAGLVCYRARSDDGNAGGTQITLAAGTRGTWSSGGFVEKDATNMPGVYELGLPTTAVASGSNFVVVMCKGATNLAPMLLEIALTDYDAQNATTLGLTNLDVAVSSRMATFTLPTNFSALSIDASGRIDLGKWIGVAPSALNSGTVQVDVERWLNGVIPAVNVTGEPLVDVNHWRGTQPSLLNSGTVQADVERWVNAVPNSLVNSRVPTSANIQQNTAGPTFGFLITDNTNHNPKTGAAALACARSIDGGAFGACTNTPAEVGNGIYSIALSAGDLNGKVIVVRITSTNNDDTFFTLTTGP